MKKVISILIIFLTFSIVSMEEKEIWNIKKELQHSTNIKSATYNSLSKQIYILDEKNVTLINVDDEKQLITLPHSSLWKPSFDPSGRHILTSPKDKTIELSNTDGKKITTITTKGDSLQVVSFNPQGNQILVTDQKNVQLRNLDGLLITNYNAYISGSKYRVEIAKFFPHNDNLIFLAPFDVSHKAKLWDIRNRNIITYDYIDSLKQSYHTSRRYLHFGKKKINKGRI